MRYGEFFFYFYSKYLVIIFFLCIFAADILDNMKLTTIYLFIFALLFSTSAHAIDEERVFTIMNASNGLADNRTQLIVCTKTGRMIIATAGNLNFYDGSSFTFIAAHHENRMQLPAYRGNPNLHFDHYHHLWLKDANYVTCVDMLMEKFVSNPDSVLKKLGCKAPVLDLFTDNTGDLWYVTENGLHDVDSAKTYQLLRDRHPHCVDVYQDNVLIFYDNGEAFALNRMKGNIVHNNRAYEWEESQKYASSTVIRQYKDSYFVIKSGPDASILLRLDLKTFQWTKIIEVPYHLNNMALKDTKLYIASSHGYWIYDIDQNTSTHIEQLKLTNGRQLETECNTIMLDKQGGLWIGTDKRGVLYAPLQPSPFRVYSWDDPKAVEYSNMMGHLTQNIAEFNGKQANCMYDDSRKYTWFGTINGLYMFREPKSEPIVFNRSNGLLSDVIHSIVEDKEHNIWVSTSCGISCIIFDKGKPVFVNSFNSHDNVPDEAFLNAKAMCLEDSTIIMQSIDHVVEFNPNRLKIVNEKKLFGLYPKLIRLLVNGSFVKPGEEVDGNVIIDRSITRAWDISLNANQNSISMTFSALNYYRPLQTFYRVKVSGLNDEGWKVYSYFNGTGFVDSHGMLHLPLINLKPGDYEVQVQASMFPDLWDDSVEYKWVVHVNQPWWQATGVYMLIVLVILVLLVMNLIVFSKNTRMRARRNTEEGDIIRRITSFVVKCDAYREETLAPTSDELFSADFDQNGKLSSDFIALMLKLSPYVRERKNKTTMKELSNIGGIDIVKLYSILTSNLYKSPRELACLFSLQKAAEQLRTTDKTIEEIATECRFYTPNYFMGCFFHEYKMTPREYREESKG